MRPSPETLCVRWLAVGLAASFAPACSPQSERYGAAPGQAGAPPASVSVSSAAPSAPATPDAASAPGTPDPAPVAGVLAPAGLVACIPALALVAQPGCALKDPTGAAPAGCVDLAPAGSPSVGVLSILVAAAPYDFARRLGVPSMQTIIDAGTPGAEAMRETYRKFEGPSFEPATKGRKVKLEARGLMLGGVVHWATLDSPRGTFSTVVVRQIPLHDSPLADADRKAVESWDLAKIATCLDGRLWP